jgi:hypothetical protein
LNGLDEQELTALQVAALLGDGFRLDDLIELNSIKASKLLNLLRKMVKENIIGEKSGNAEGIYFFFVKKIFPNTILKSMKDKNRKFLLSIIIPY